MARQCVIGTSTPPGTVCFMATNACVFVVRDTLLVYVLCSHMLHVVVVDFAC